MVASHSFDDFSIEFFPFNHCSSFCFENIFPGSKSLSENENRKELDEREEWVIESIHNISTSGKIKCGVNELKCEILYLEKFLVITHIGTAASMLIFQYSSLLEKKKYGDTTLDLEKNAAEARKKHVYYIRILCSPNVPRNQPVFDRNLLPSRYGCKIEVFSGIFFLLCSTEKDPKTYPFVHFSFSFSYFLEPSIHFFVVSINQHKIMKFLKLWEKNTIYTHNSMNKPDYDPK